MILSTLNIPRGTSRAQLCAIIDVIAPDIDIKWESGVDGYSAYVIDNPIAVMTINGTKIRIDNRGNVVAYDSNS